MWDSSNLPFSEYTNIKYIWCKSKYPTLKADLTSFPTIFSENKFYGYSDHALGISYCLMAIARGAKYIEKHFTLNKSNDAIRDHVLSAEPNEFELLVKLGREISANLNN
jgi:sialic acid synthase SpsE